LPFSDFIVNFFQLFALLLELTINFIDFLLQALHFLLFFLDLLGNFDVNLFWLFDVFLSLKKRSTQSNIFTLDQLTYYQNIVEISIFQRVIVIDDSNLFYKSIIVMTFKNELACFLIETEDLLCNFQDWFLRDINPVEL
jgi:hypothetical protein